MHRVFWAFLAVAFLVVFPVSVGSATELNGALKSGKTHDDLKSVVTTADLKAEKIPPLPELLPRFRIDEVPQAAQRLFNRPATPRFQLQSP